MQTDATPEHDWWRGDVEWLDIENDGKLVAACHVNGAIVQRDINDNFFFIHDDGQRRYPYVEEFLAIAAVPPPDGMAVLAQHQDLVASSRTRDGAPISPALEKWGFPWEERSKPLFDHLDQRVARKAAEWHGMFDAGLDALDEPAYLIDGVLVRDSLAALYGHPGSGKSFAALDMALCVATGRWWHGRPVQQGPVVYIAAERARGMKKRRRAWKEHNAVSDDADMFWLPVPVNLLDSDTVTALTAAVAVRKPALVVIDTLSRTMPGGNESGSEVMSRWVEHADRIRQATGACVLIVHHSPRDGSYLRGHTSLEAAVDTAVECRHRSSKTGHTVTLTCTKQNDDAEFEPVKLALVEVGDSCALDSSATSMSAVALDMLRALADIADETGVSTAVWRDSCLCATNDQSPVARRTFYRQREKLLADGLVANVGTGKAPRNIITEQGKQVLHD